MQVTKDADKLVCNIYKTYLSRRNNGLTKSEAKSFDSDFYIEIPSLSSWSEDDIDETLNELKRAGFIKKYIYGDFQIQDDFIIYMENRFKNGLTEITDFISRFIP